MRYSLVIYISTGIKNRISRVIFKSEFGEFFSDVRISESQNYSLNTIER
jgi:hypothetical protein